MKKKMTITHFNNFLITNIQKVKFRLRTKTNSTLKYINEFFILFLVMLNSENKFLC